MGGELSGGGCSQAGNRSAVELLLSYGADVNAQNKQGKSCLQFGKRCVYVCICV